MRTTLDLFPDKPLAVRDGFSLNFDIKFDRQEHNYGYVFRIIINDTLNIDMLSNVGWINTQLSVIKGSSVIVNVDNIDAIPGYAVGGWMRFGIGIDRKKGMITLDLNGMREDIPTQIPSMKNVRVVFGANTRKPFVNTDIPPINLRNISVADLHGKDIYRWPMLMHGDGEVYDDIRGARAGVVNGNWEIDRYLNWQELAYWEMDGFIPQSALFTIGSEQGIYVAKDELVYRFSFRDDDLEILSATGGPYTSSANSLVYDPDGPRLISYSIESDRLNTYELETGIWSGGEVSPAEGFFSLLHHNSFYLPDSKQIVLFGGYDHYRYNSRLYCYTEDRGIWEYRDLAPAIEPRYLSAAGYDGHKALYILGGYGSSSGKQEEFPGNYYDLYEVSLADSSVRNLWTFTTEQDEVFGNHMVCDTLNGIFYALSYSNHKAKTFIRLNRIDIKNKERVILADSIPFTFYDTQSYCTLFLDSINQRLIALVITGQEVSSSIRIYGIKYRPMQYSEVIQSVPSGKKFPLRMEYGVGAIAFLLAVLFLVRRAFYGNGPGLEEELPQERIDSSSAQDSIQLTGPSDDIRPLSVMILGTFKVIDGQGSDCTRKFSVTLRNIFIYMLLNLARSGNGVTSKQLDETFWGGNEKGSATNSRNVTMSRLRNLLKETSLATIEHTNSAWYLNLDQDVYCDYLHIVPLLQSLCGKGTDVDISVIKQIIGIGRRGPLASNIQEPWIDKYKSDYLFLVSDALLGVFELAAIKDNPHLLLKLADMMLVYDSLDEDALRYKCHALCLLGKAGQAKMCYETYRYEYVTALGTEPSFNFEEILSM